MKKIFVILTVGIICVLCVSCSSSGSNEQTTSEVTAAPTVAEQLTEARISEEIYGAWDLDYHGTHLCFDFFTDDIMYSGIVGDTSNISTSDLKNESTYYISGKKIYAIEDDGDKDVFDCDLVDGEFKLYMGGVELTKLGDID